MKATKMKITQGAKTQGRREKVKNQEVLTSKSASVAKHNNEYALPPPPSALPSHRLPDLCSEDKARIAKLIHELVQVSSEYENASSSWKEEKQLFENKIEEISKEKDVLLFENNAMKERMVTLKEQNEQHIRESQSTRIKFGKSLALVPQYQTRLMELQTQYNELLIENETIKKERSKGPFGAVEISAAQPDPHPGPQHKDLTQEANQIDHQVDEQANQPSKIEIDKSDNEELRQGSEERIFGEQRPNRSKKQSKRIVDHKLQGDRFEVDRHGSDTVQWMEKVTSHAQNRIKKKAPVVPSYEGIAHPSIDMMNHFYADHNPNSTVIQHKLFGTGPHGHESRREHTLPSSSALDSTGPSLEQFGLSDQKPQDIPHNVSLSTIHGHQYELSLLDLVDHLELDT